MPTHLKATFHLCPHVLTSCTTRPVDHVRTHPHELNGYSLSIPPLPAFQHSSQESKTADAAAQKALEAVMALSKGAEDKRRSRDRSRSRDRDRDRRSSRDRSPRDRSRDRRDRSRSPRDRSRDRRDDMSRRRSPPRGPPVSLFIPVIMLLNSSMLLDGNIHATLRPLPEEDVLLERSSRALHPMSYQTFISIHRSCVVRVNNCATGSITRQARLRQEGTSASPLATPARERSCARPWRQPLRPSVTVASIAATTTAAVSISDRG